MEKINIIINFNVNRVPKLEYENIAFVYLEYFQFLIKYSINEILFHNI
jgi:hypothetical protein